MMPVATGITGILATKPSDPEVFAVFPAINAVTLVFDQELRIRRGDTYEIPIQVQDDDQDCGPSAVDLSRAALRFAVKQGNHLPDDLAMLTKRSWSPREIEIVHPASNGQAILRLRRSDTRELPLVPAVWDLEMLLATELLESVGVVSTTAGSSTITGTGTSFLSAVEPGDIIDVSGLLVLITDVVSDTEIRVDWSAWATDSGIEHRLYRGVIKTVAGGSFVVMGDTIR